MFLGLPLEHCSWHCTDHRVDMLTVLEEQDGRNGAVVIPHGGLLIRVDVELRHRYAAGVFAGELLQDRRDHAARAAPRCPEVHDGQALPALDLGGESRIRYGDRAAVLTHSDLLLRWRAGLTAGDAACYLVENVEPLQKTRRSLTRETKAGSRGDRGRIARYGIAAVRIPDGRRGFRDRGSSGAGRKGRVRGVRRWPTGAAGATGGRVPRRPLSASPGSGSAPHCLPGGGSAGDAGCARVAGSAIDRPYASPGSRRASRRVPAPEQHGRRVDRARGGLTTSGQSPRVSSWMAISSISHSGSAAERTSTKGTGVMRLPMVILTVNCVASVRRPGTMSSCARL